MTGVAIGYALQVVISLLVAQLRLRGVDVSNLDQIVQNLIDEERDPTPEEKAALQDFLAAQRAELHS